MVNITYCIPVCNEAEELKLLIDHLMPFIERGDEVLIQGDDGNVSDLVYDVVEDIHPSPQYRYIEYPLNGDFAAFKNNLILNAKKDWIVLIDADELPHPTLLKSLKYLIDDNPNVDLFRVPRFNVVCGLTDEWKTKWGWNTVTEKLGKSEIDLLRKSYNLSDESIELVNLPDYQSRIFKRTDGIKWQGKVHEQLVGIGSYCSLPFDTFDFGFFHVKEIERQIRQNNLYEKLT